MQLQASVAALSLALAAFSVEASVPVTIYNQCSESIDLYDNSASETVAAGGTTSRTLSEGFSGMFRNGVSAQATLAEFSVTGGFLWYDISIIPTGAVGPGYCSSLAECKAVTGGTGYNTPMQIAPSGCTTLTCLEDGCADAYQYPKDDTKTHACSDSTSVVLTFCPGGSGGSTQSTYESTQQQVQQQATTSAPTAAPTPAPTQVPTTQPPTQAPTTQPPTQPPTEAPTTQPPTEAPTTQPPTEAPTTQPPTEAPTTQPPTEAPTTQPPTEAPTETPTPTPTSTPEVTYAASNSTSGDEEQAATVSPSKGTKTGTTTGTPAPATTAPVAQVVSAPSTSSGDSTQSANTQSSASSGTGAGTYIATGLGCCAVIAAVAVVAVARKKKQELDATEEKEYNQEDLMTPVTQINVL